MQDFEEAIRCFVGARIQYDIYHRCTQLSASERDVDIPEDVTRLQRKLIKEHMYYTSLTGRGGKELPLQRKKGSKERAPKWLVNKVFKRLVAKRHIPILTLREEIDETYRTSYRSFVERIAGSDTRVEGPKTRQKISLQKELLGLEKMLYEHPEFFGYDIHSADNQRAEEADIAHEAACEALSERIAIMFAEGHAQAYNRTRAAYEIKPYGEGQRDTETMRLVWKGLEEYVGKALPHPLEYRE